MHVSLETSSVPAYQRKMEESLGRGAPSVGSPKTQAAAPKGQAAVPKGQAAPPKQAQQPQAGGIKRADSSLPPRQAPPQTAQYTVQTTTSAPAKQPAAGSNADREGFLPKEKQMEKFLVSNQQDNSFQAIKAQERAINSNPQAAPEKFTPPPSLEQIRQQQERQTEIRKIDQFLFGEQGQIVQQYPPQQHQQQAPSQQQYFHQPGVQDATQQMGNMNLNQQPQPARNPFNPFA